LEIIQKLVLRVNDTAVKRQPFACGKENDQRMQTYFWTALIFFFAGFTQGVSGFGSILLSLPLLALFLDIKKVIPLTTLAGVSMSILIFFQLRHHFDWKKILPIFLGALPGVPVGVLFLKKLDPVAIQWILGILLVAYALYGLFFRA